MKIGILTFHRALNFGAILQCFALYKVLSQMGCDVEVIDYRPQSIEKYRMYFRKKDFQKAKGFFGKLRYLISCLTLLGSKCLVNHKFDVFIKTNLAVSKVVRGANDVPQYFDAIVFGSDQIWSPEHCEGLDKVYYGQFPKDNTKFISYAVSIGRLEMIQGKRRTIFQEYLQSFDKISVRETSVQVFLKEQFNIDAEVVCDPSLLLSRADYDSVTVRPKDSNYLLVLNFVGGDEMINYSKYIAKQLNLKIIQIGAVKNPLHFNSGQRANLSPNEFLGYIRYARCVVTDSFHATVFSLIMHKDFYTILRHNNNDRTRTILSLVGLSERLVDKRERKPFLPVSYSGVDEKLEKLRKSSLLYLKENIGLYDS